MNVVYITTDDPIYLPSFFERVLAARPASAVYVVPPLYRNQTVRAAAWRYVSTFGWRAALALTARTLGTKMRRQSIARVCARHGVPCERVGDVNDPALLDRLRSLGTDVAVSVSCPQIFKKDLIELPTHGCLNVHGAILPRYRGVMPSFWMLANGEKRAGVSVFFVNEDIDAGELCGQRDFEIQPDESLDEFLRRSKAVAAELVIDVLGDIERGAASRTPLDLTQGSYYSWPDRAAVQRFHAAGRRLW
jgi:methionyl-tRNA formyltransferase